MTVSLRDVRKEIGTLKFQDETRFNLHFFSYFFKEIYTVKIFIVLFLHQKSYTVIFIEGT